METTLSIPQRTTTVTPVVTRDLQEMEARTNQAFEDASSARWFYWHEEGTVGLTAKERLVYLFFVMSHLHDRRTVQDYPRTVENCSEYLGMELTDVRNTLNCLIERGYLNACYRRAGFYEDAWMQRKGLLYRPYKQY